MAPKPRTTAIRIRELKDPADPILRQAHALLKKNFSDNELVGLHEWLGSLEEKAGRVLVDVAWHLFVAVSNGKVVGLATGTYLGNVNVGMIGYLAIAPQVRLRGLGNRLRARLRAQFERDARTISGKKLDAIIGEVSADNPWLHTLGRRPAVAVLDFEYFQPHLNPGDSPSSFFLYRESVGSRARRIKADELRRLLYAVWRRIYRVRRPLDSPEFRSMIRSIGNRRTIGPMKIQPVTVS